MFGRDKKRDKKEHLAHRYPGLFQRPHLLNPEFDADHSLPLVRYRILVNGEEDAAGEFHSDPDAALYWATGMISAARYGLKAKRLAEVEVYDADGNLLGRDRQLHTKAYSSKTVQWESCAGLAARAERTEAMVRAMGPPRLGLNP